MSLLSVVKDVCYAVGVNPPTSLFATSIQPRTQAEFLSLANEMAQRIAWNTREWTALKKYASFAGDGVTFAFPMPSDYQRMTLTSQVRRQVAPRYPLHFIADPDEWLTRRMENNIGGPWGEWTLIGTDMHIWPIMPEGDFARFVYMDRGCIRTAMPMPPETSNNVPFFLSDDDVFRLDERLLKLGMIWQWKANKGSPFAEDLSTYGDAIQMAMGADKPAPLLIDPAPRPNLLSMGGGYLANV